MKQLIQNYKTEELELVKVPVPIVKLGVVLVRNVHSLLSVGTELYRLILRSIFLLLWLFFVS